MPKSFACRDDGEFPDCPAVMSGETDEDIVRQALEHGRQELGMTDEQLRDPVVEQGIRGYIREA